MTDWLAFFKKNGKRCWKWTKERGWFEDSNSVMLKYYAYGEDSKGRTYVAYAHASPKECLISRGPHAEKKYLEEKRLDALAHLETFLHRDCRCRVGYHWKCKIHGTWKG